LRPGILGAGAGASREWRMTNGEHNLPMGQLVNGPMQLRMTNDEYRMNRKLQTVNCKPTQVREMSQCNDELRMADDEL